MGHFLPVDHWLPPKIKILKNWETNLKIYYLNVHHKWQSYDLWLRYRTWQTLFVILDCFLPFHPPDDPKNQNFEKMNATLGDIIILQMCTINDNHMMYGSWDMEYDRKKFSSFWTVFCSFTNNPENQNFWKNERNGDIILHMSHKWQSYDVWFLKYGARRKLLSFWALLCPFTPPTIWKKTKFWKMEKTPEYIIIVHLCTTNDDHMMHGS